MFLGQVGRPVCQSGLMASLCTLWTFVGRPTSPPSSRPTDTCFVSVEISRPGGRSKSTDSSNVELSVGRPVDRSSVRATITIRFENLGFLTYSPADIFFLFEPNLFPNDLISYIYSSFGKDYRLRNLLILGNILKNQVNSKEKVF